MQRKKTSKKRLVRGRDWHGYALKLKDGRLIGPAVSWKPVDPLGGRWVRVRFVEVE